MGQRLEDAIEWLLFASRWLLAPFYLGLAAALLLLLAVFGREFAQVAAAAGHMPAEQAILALLSLIDLVLAANLVLLVVLAGYENFVSRIDTGDHRDRPTWMGKVGFSGLKLKLYSSIVAISGIQLLKAFMGVGDGEFDERKLLWLAIIHLVFIATAVFAALTDRLSGAKV